MSLDISTLSGRLGFQRALSTSPVFGSTMVRAPTPIYSDVELIEACREIVALRDQVTAVHAANEAQGEETQIEPLIEAIGEKKERLLQQIESLGDPKTLEGVRALAAAAMSLAPPMRGGPIARDDFEWLLLRSVEFFTRGSGSVT